MVLFRWYVLRATYGRALSASVVLEELGYRCYVPTHVEVKVTESGRRKTERRPLLPSLVFIYATEQFILKEVKEGLVAPYVSIYYDHFNTKYGRNVPLVIPDGEMENFIRLTSVEDEHVEVVDESRCRFQSGDIVEVTGGPFAGVWGRVVRVARQTRVLVNLRGVCLVATSYVPKKLLKKVDQQGGN